VVKKSVNSENREERDIGMVKEMKNMREIRWREYGETNFGQVSASLSKLIVHKSLYQFQLCVSYPGIV
jgi:hypothetical protein